MKIFIFCGDRLFKIKLIGLSFKAAKFYVAGSIWKTLCGPQVGQPCARLTLYLLYHPTFTVVADACVGFLSITYDTVCQLQFVFMF